uniref:Uncharacterized protein n=1 Tax=Panagrolaimus sp. ES5 TaxID=591445 RepID=A0AC34GI25_9BILA
MILRIFFGIFLFSSSTFAWFYGRPDPGSTTQGGVWPLPWSINYSNNDSYAINPSTFQFNSWQSGCSIIDKALQRYKKLAFPGYSNSSSAVQYSTKANSIVSVTVTVKKGCNNDYPQFGMDES